MGDRLVSFPQNGDESQKSSQKLSNIYDRMRMAASQVISSIMPEDSVTPASRDTNRQAPSIETTATQECNTLGGLLPSFDHTETPTKAPRATQFLNRHSRANSVATVGISRIDSDQLQLGTIEQNSSPFAAAPRTHTSPPRSQLDAAFEYPATDTDSIISGVSQRASRAYLADQYSRSRRRSANSLGRDFWMKDENASSCFRCGKSFTTFRRRHHCRVCGQIFCSSCTKLLPGTRFHQAGKVRCCLDCVNSLNTQQHSSDEDEHLAVHSSEYRDLTGSLPSTYADSASVFASPSGQTGALSTTPLTSPGRALNQDTSEPGSAVDTAIMSFHGPHPPLRIPYNGDEPDSHEHEKLIRSKSVTRLHLGSNYQMFGRPRSNTSRSGVSFHRPTSQVDATRENWVYSSAKQRGHTTSSTADINKAGLKYSKLYLDKILEDSKMDVGQWQSIMMPILLTLVVDPHLDTSNRDKMDVQEWVKFKCLPGGFSEDLELVNGVVFTHNVLRKSMPRTVNNPRILLISFPIEYSRGEGSYMSLGPVLAQEDEYLNKQVARIKSLRPTMLLSSSRISGHAIERLQECGIVVATNVRERALHRLSLYIRTDILTSQDRLSMSPCLGMCNYFEVCTYIYENVAKSFMFFVGNSEGLGSSVIVRGSKDVVRRAKAVMQVMVDVMFSLKMETSLMRDEFVSIPELPEHPVVLSSSAFVDYGRPLLLTQAEAREDELVKLSDEAKSLAGAEAAVSEATAVTQARADESVESGTKSAAKKLLEVEAAQEVTLQHRSDLTDKIKATAKSFGLPLSKLPGGLLSLFKMCQTIQGDRVDTAYTTWMDAKHQWEQLENYNPYMFYPCSHQALITSFALICDETSNYCVGPEPLSIAFYMNTDVPIGQYIETAINSFNELCPEGCSKRLGEHRRTYYHGNGVLSLRIEKYPCELQGLQDSVLMWNYCKICEKSTPITPMSSSTWKYSFGKYLELSFWGQPLYPRADSCKHNIYREQTRYFGWKDMAVKVDYTDIELFDVVGPRLVIRWDAADLVRMKNEAYKHILSRIKRFWSSLLDNLNQVKVEGLDEKMMAESHAKLEELKAKAEKDKLSSYAKLDEVYLCLPPTKWLELNSALQFTQDLVSTWHDELDHFDGLFFPTERDIRRVTAQQLRRLFNDEESRSSTERGMHDQDEGDVGSSYSGTNLHVSESDNDNVVEASNERDAVHIPKPISPVPIKHKAGEMPTENQHFLGSSSVPAKSKLGTDINIPISSIEDNLPRHRRGNKVSLLAEHFEELSQEFEKERQRERQRLYRRQQASIIGATRPVAEVFQDVKDALKEDWDGPITRRSSDPSQEEQRDTHVEPSEPQDQGSDIEDVTSPAGSDASSQSDKARQVFTQPTAIERKSLIKSLVNFWAERSATRWSALEYVLSPGEHLFSDSSVIIRDNEPSSLVAFCLSLPDYQKRVNEIYLPMKSTGDEPSLEEVLLKSTGVHMKYQFSRGTAKLSCKIFFSEQFDALRRQCGAADNYIQCLSQCSPWETQGGKSGSSFLKTSDGRLILKELNQAEFDALASFTPSYFEYMTQALFHELPTVLAKILGIYQIQIYNPATSTNARSYVIIMENLFYGREFTQYFDLKGSMRNRKVPETGSPNQVLLDENMVEYMYEKPMYVSEHIKKMLRTCLYNDTLFLTKMNVMDYSLVVGINEESKSIVIGIIDFIRTFTWDKKIESWVKGRATAGVIEPTVISPKQYKVRFRESMERYFLPVPDCWQSVPQANPLLLPAS